MSDCVEAVDSIDDVRDMKKGCRDLGGCSWIGLGGSNKPESSRVGGGRSDEEHLRRFFGGSTSSLEAVTGTEACAVALSDCTTVSHR